MRTVNLKIVARNGGAMRQEKGVEPGSEFDTSGPSDVEWRVCIDIDEASGVVSLRPAGYPWLASGPTLSLTRGNATVFPDEVNGVDLEVAE
jgi:hypothetical protein